MAGGTGVGLWPSALRQHSPIEALATYLDGEPHDVTLLTFYPQLVAQVRQRLRVPGERCRRVSFSIRRRCLWLHLGRAAAWVRTISGAGSS